MVLKPFARTLCVAFLMSLLAGASAPTPGRYPLRHRVAVGDRQLWESISEASLTFTERSGNQETPPIQSTTRFREKYEEDVLAARGAAVTRLRQHCLVARTYTTDPSGKQAVETSSLQGKTVTVERKGARVVVRAAGVKVSADDRERLSHALEQAHIPFLPNREAALGEEWTVTTDAVKVFFPQARTGAMQARFAEVTRYAGRKCAHLRLTGELELAIEGIPAPVKAQLSGELYHALDIQRPVALEFAGPLTVNAPIEQGGRSITLSGDGKMSAKVSIQWQKVAGKRIAAPKASTQPAAALEPPSPG